MNRLQIKLKQLVHISGNYRKYLAIVLFAATIPGVLFSFLLIFVSKSQMEIELQSVHQNHSINTIESIQAQFTDLEMLMANWAFSPNTQEYMDLDLVNDYQMVREFYHVLSLMGGYNPLIGRMEVFLNQQQPIIFTENGYKRLENNQLMDNYADLLKSQQRMFWNHSLKSIEEGYRDRYAPLVMVHNLVNNRFEPIGSLMVFLDKETFEKLLQSPYEDGSVFLWRGDNKWLFAKEDQTEPDLLQSAVMDEITKRNRDIEPFVFQHGNTSYTVTYDYFPRLGEIWHYVSIAPLSNIIAPVVIISEVFIYLNLLVFVLAILLILFASKKLYEPVEKITRRIGGENRRHTNEFNLIERHLDHLSTESEEMRNRLVQQSKHLREGFILQLVQGYLYAYREEDLQVRMHQLGSQLTSNKYLIVFVQLFGFNRLKGRYSEGDEGLVTFLAVNITEELLRSSSLEADVVNFHDLSLGILFSFPSDANVKDVEDQALNFCEELTGYINSICKMNVSMGVSRAADLLKSVPTIFEETKVSLSFRNLHENNQIIEIGKMDNLLNRHDRYEYPFDLEKEITHAIRLRNQEEAIKLVHEFFTVPAEQNISVAMLKQGALKLLGSILHIVLQAGFIEDFAKEGVNLYDELYKLNDPEEICEWLERKVVIPIIDELSRKQDQRLRLIVQKVMDMLDTHYMNDISLEQCADEVNLNPSILSKVFKDFSGWNFIDYLTNIRLSKAKELLSETDTKIKDIAEQTGYQHSYFNRIFKKHEGITPSEYRDMYRKT